MSKKPAKATKTDKPAADGAAPPKKRSKLKLALFALVPLLLAGGGYAGWTQFFAAPAEAAVGQDSHGTEAAHGPAPIPPEVAAETSYTHSYALLVLLAPRCGGMLAPALKAASEAEAHADGMLAHLSWQAAARRAANFTEKSCGYVLSEVETAEYRAAEAAAPPKSDKAAAHH